MTRWEKARLQALKIGKSQRKRTSIRAWCKRVKQALRGGRDG